MHEIEVKILEVDAEDIEKRLEALGAELVQDSILNVDWYRVKGLKEGEDEWFLRIRIDSSGKAEVTWKRKPQKVGITKQAEEINFIVSDPVACGKFFEVLNLEKYAHQEKKRTSWILDNLRFDMDTYPGIPTYLEIEGEGEEEIKLGIKLLNLENHQTSSDGERVLIQEHYKKHWHQMRF